MDKDNIMTMEYMDSYGSCDFEMIAIYNKSRISDEQVKKVIQSNAEDVNVIKVYKHQFDNVFKKED